MSDLVLKVDDPVYCEEYGYGFVFAVDTTACAVYFDKQHRELYTLQRIFYAHDYVTSPGSIVKRSKNMGDLYDQSPNAIWYDIDGQPISDTFHVYDEVEAEARQLQIKGHYTSPSEDLAIEEYYQEQLL